ncbi:hypothetical protein BJV82DRAFT_670547 [Fennellomyces sp. T-0311]|nr:hypothetical protein BJV82DRAFT_670547 [Fennellomyces sp. T-0311]
MKFSTLLTVSLSILGANVAQAKLAIDTFDLTQPSVSLLCAHDEGFDGIALGSYSEGQPQPYCSNKYMGAKYSGFTDIDLSFRPCVHRGCTSPEQQVQGFLTFVNGKQMAYRYIWLHVESGSWLTPEENRQTLQKLKTALGAVSGISFSRWGVKTSRAEWEAITGSADWELDNKVPLWYSNNDGAPNFSDYIPFGGWQAPYAKQYAKDVHICGATFSESYYAY